MRSFAATTLLVLVAGCPVPKAHDTTPLKPIAASLWIGAPDSAATTVVYTFSNPITCAELQMIAWDKRITDGTQILEMKMFGTATGAFKATQSPTPAAGEASVNRTLSHQTAEPLESFATDGTVTLTELVAGMNAKGSFTYTVDGVALSGAFHATFCPGGHEP